MNNKSICLILLSFLIALFFLAGCSSTQKVAPLQDGDAFKLVDMHSFTFVADNVSPLRGRTRSLNSDYTITVNNDSIISYLPYFGRATQAPMNPSESGLRFTSTDFSYKIVQGKKNQKELTIIPHDRRDIQELFFVFYDNGTGTLSITSTFRDPISFSGHLQRVR